MKIWHIIYFFFLENILKQTWNCFNTKFQPQGKDWKSSYQIKEVLALFCLSIALMVGYNCVKELRVTKIVKEIKFERIWGWTRIKKCFQKQSFTKPLGPTLVFMWNSALPQKFNFCFSTFILKERLGTRLSFYERKTLSWYFLLF